MLWSIFQKGGPIMWPLLLTSLVALSVVIERLAFIYREKKQRQDNVVEQILNLAEKKEFDKAIEAGKNSSDVVAKTLVAGLIHRNEGFSSALLLSATRELKSFTQGLSILDTIITLAPLLGLFGTVTGMIGAFGLLGSAGLDAPTAITGGIAEALIATAFGLLIAMVSLIPFNYLNARVEEARHNIEEAATHLELLVLRDTK